MAKTAAQEEAEREAEREALNALPAMEKAIRAGAFIYCYEAHPTRGFECWDWLMGLVELTYKLIKQGRVRQLRLLVTYTSTKAE